MNRKKFKRGQRALPTSVRLDSKPMAQSSRESEVAVDVVSGGPPRKTWIAASERGVVRIQLGGSRRAFLDELIRLGYVPKGKKHWTRRAQLEIAGYLSGRRRRFTFSLDPPAMTRFTAGVLGVLAKVPFGQLISYGSLAARAGFPKAARAVGGVMARNPLPLVIPCHRVVGAQGLVGFGGGLKMKRDLLALEGVIGAGGIGSPNDKSHPFLW